MTTYPQQNTTPSPTVVFITPEQLRQIVREEMDAALQRLMIGEQRLLADITEPQDEQEELAAVLATLTPGEWETLVQRVRERKAHE